MKVSCKYCGRIHDRRFDCGKKPKRHKDGTAAVAFRNSNRWKKKTEEIRERDLYMCAACAAEGMVTQKGLEVHHIVSLDENMDLALEDSNLITLCAEHHKLAERGKIPADVLKAWAEDIPLPSVPVSRG